MDSQKLTRNVHTGPSDHKKVFLPQKRRLLPTMSSKVWVHQLIHTSFILCSMWSSLLDCSNARLTFCSSFAVAASILQKSVEIRCIHLTPRAVDSVPILKLRIVLKLV